MAHGPWTDNRMLDGKILLRQPVRGFRSGSDAVLLAAACRPPMGGRVLDLGCGSGAALLSLGWRRPDLDLTGLEIDAASARLADFNLKRNRMHHRGRIVTGNVARPPLPQDSFDLVLANPPYFAASRNRRSPDADKDRARTEGDTRLADWITAARLLLRTEGEAILILRREREDDLLRATRGARVQIRPVVGARQKPAKRMLVRMTFGTGAAGTETLAPLYLHRDDTSDTALAQNLFRHGAPLRW